MLPPVPLSAFSFALAKGFHYLVSSETMGMHMDDKFTLSQRFGWFLLTTWVLPRWLGSFAFWLVRDNIPKQGDAE